MNNTKKIAIISTGGTIAASENNSRPDLESEQLLEQHSDLLTDVDFAFYRLPHTCFSPHLQPCDIITLGNIISSAEEEGCSGAVITHGTDTMEETSWFLQLIRRWKIPIVLTGAQRTPSNRCSDGVSNLIDSILTVMDDNAADIINVAVCFGGDIFDARDVTKWHKNRLDAFNSEVYGPLGSVANERIYWHRKVFYQEPAWEIVACDKRVEIIPAFLGADSKILQYAADIADGIVLSGLGVGHLPEKMIDGLQHAINHLQLPVVLCSRVPHGQLLTDTYKYLGSETYLQSIGIIFGQGLSPIKARIKLMVLLAAGLSLEEIKKSFEAY